MAENTDSLPRQLQDIVEDFKWAEGREKLELLLDFSDRMPLLPDWLAEQRDGMEQVHECMTPVFIHAEANDGRMIFYFDVPPESPTVRGFASLMAEGLSGTTPQEILAIPGDFYREMGLPDVLSYQRLNGISAILSYMKRLALREIGA
ncbi:MAG: SufE family protein [Chloroflexota bacterium]|nr:SufE family protein [Chloroflexota bacterium]